MPLLALVSTLLLAADLTGDVLDGRRNQTNVKPPRPEEAGLRMDGSLDEPQWRQPSTLTGFSQFSPRDGVPADDSTEVLVWYSSTAIHFGVRAYEPHEPVRSALADRDKIFSDDRVELLLGTFNDGRQAVVLGVNPLGVQMDGTLVENNQARLSGAGESTRELPDLRPDYVFQSKGRLTSYGYEVEMRVPFKSLKYQSSGADLGLQRRSGRAALRARGQMGAGAARQRVLPASVGHARGVERPAAGGWSSTSRRR